MVEPVAPASGADAGAGRPTKPRLTVHCGPKGRIEIGRIDTIFAVAALMMVVAGLVSFRYLRGSATSLEVDAEPAEVAPQPIG